MLVLGLGLKLPFIQNQWIHEVVAIKLDMLSSNFTRYHVGLVAKKPDFVGGEQQNHRPACASTEFKLYQTPCVPPCTKKLTLLDVSNKIIDQPVHPLSSNFTRHHLGLVTTKPDFVGCKQQNHRPACASTEFKLYQTPFGPCHDKTWLCWM